MKFSIEREQKKQQQAAAEYSSQHKKKKHHKRVLREIERQAHAKALEQERELESLREKNNKTEKELYELYKKHTRLIQELQRLSTEIKELKNVLATIRENYARQMASIADRVEINGVAAFNPGDKSETINTALALRTKIAIAMEQLKQERQNTITSTAGSTRMLHGLSIARAQATHSREYDEKHAALQEKFQQKKTEWVKQFCPEIHWKGKSKEACAAFFDQVFEHELLNSLLKEYDKDTEPTVEKIAEVQIEAKQVMHAEKETWETLQSTENVLDVDTEQFIHKKKESAQKSVLQETEVTEVIEEKTEVIEEKTEVSIESEKTLIAEDKKDILLNAVNEFEKEPLDGGVLLDFDYGDLGEESDEPKVPSPSSPKK